MPLVTTPYGDQVLLPDEYSQVDPTAVPGAVVPGTPMPSGPSDPGYQAPQSVQSMIAPTPQGGPLGGPAGAAPAPLQIGQTAGANSLPPALDAGDATQTAIGMVHRMWDLPLPASVGGDAARSPTGDPSRLPPSLQASLSGTAPHVDAATSANGQSLDALAVRAYNGDVAAQLEIAKRAKDGDAHAMTLQAASGVFSPNHNRVDPALSIPQQSAINEHQEANRVQSAADEKQAQAGLAAQATYNQAQEDQIAKRNAIFDAKQQHEALWNAKIDTAAREANDYKIDPLGGITTGEKAGWLIGMALSGIGLSMMGKGDAPNPVIGMIEQHIKDGVARQMDQRNQLRQKVTDLKDSRGRALQGDDDQLSQQLVLQAQETQRFSNKVKLAAAASAVPTVKARAVAMDADLQQRTADLYQQAKAVAWDQKFKETSQKIEQQQADTARSHVGLGYAQLGEETRAHKATEGLTARGQDLTLAGKEDALAAKAAAAKGVAELGIRDPATGDYLATPKQKELKARADELRAAAAATQDPIKQQTLNANADSYDDAAQKAVYRVGQKEQQPKTQDIVNNAQTVVDQVSEINRALASDPGVTDVATRARIKSAYQTLKLTLGKTEGARVNEAAQSILDDIVNVDPGDWTTAVKDKFHDEYGNISASLNTYKNTVVNQAKNHLRGALGPTDWQPRELQVNDKGLAPIDEVQQSKTPLEAAEGKEPGTAMKVINGATSWIAGVAPGTKARKEAQEAENQGSPTGLSMSGERDEKGFEKYGGQQQQVDGMIVRARKGGPASADYQMLVQMALDTRKPSLAAGVRGTLRGDAPDIYNDVLKQLPPEQQQAAQVVDTLASHFTPVKQLVDGVLAGDTRAAEELSRRAAAGDGEALRGVQLLAAMKQGH